MTEFSKLLHLVGAALRWLYDKLWRTPASIRGVPWTAALWTYLLCGFYLTDVLVQSGKPVLLPLILLTLASFVMRWQSRPKKLGRPLPYKRRR